MIDYLIMFGLSIVGILMILVSVYAIKKWSMLTKMATMILPACVAIAMMGFMLGYDGFSLVTIVVALTVAPGSMIFVILVLDKMAVKPFEKQMEAAQEQKDYLERNVNKTSAAMQKIAAGDLEVELQKERDDTIGGIVDNVHAIVNSLNGVLAEAGMVVDAAVEGKLNVRGDAAKFGGNFGKLVQGVNATLDAVVGPLKLADDVAKQVADTAQTLSASSEEMSASMDQLSSGSQQIAEGSQKLAELSQTAVNGIDDISKLITSTGESIKQSNARGEDAVEKSNVVQQNAKEAMNGLGTIQTEIRKTSSSIGDMNQSIKKVGELGSVITDVANETNMLALNAAIEAARAGEAGKGFAVVADAVKNLAEQVKSAAHDSISAVSEINEVGESTIEVSASADTAASEGGEVLETALNGVESVVAAIEEINHMIGEISGGALKIDESVNEILRAIEEVTAIAEESASAAEESSAAVEEQTAAIEELTASTQMLAGLSDELVRELSHFKLN